MTDPTDPLAHLYAEGLETDSNEIFASAVEVTLDGLNAEVDPEVEEQISDHDLAELVLLVKTRLEDYGGLPDEEAAELGLGTIEEVAGADFDHELVLNSTGRRVLKAIADQRAGGLT